MLHNGSYNFTFVGTSRIDVKVILQRGSNLDVLIYIDQANVHPAIRLFLSLCNTSVRVVDLYGNPPGSRWHRSGLGALAVNTAIQFLKQLYPPSVTLYGHVFDSKDFGLAESEQPERQEGRKAFWRTFGFEISSPDTRGDERLQGTIGALHLASTGLALGEHPRVFDISHMQFLSTS